MTEIAISRASGRRDDRSYRADRSPGSSALPQPGPVVTRAFAMPGTCSRSPSQLMNTRLCDIVRGKQNIYRTLSLSKVYVSFVSSSMSPEDVQWV